jgi:hypothetical protein
MNTGFDLHVAFPGNAAQKYHHIEYLHMRKAIHMKISNSFVVSRGHFTNHIDTSFNLQG